MGKGCGKRWLHHEMKGKCENWILRSIIKKSGGSLPKVKIRQNLTNAEAIEIEMAVIKALGRGRKGPLVNMSDGGEGLSGVPMSADVRKKISDAHKGRKQTAEHRANLSAARKRMFAEMRAAGIQVRHTEETKAKIGAAHKGRKASPEAKVKMSAARKGRKCPWSIETMRTYSRNKTPAHKEKLAAHLRSLADKRKQEKAIALGDDKGF